MVRYGKLENGQLLYAPSPLLVDGVNTWTNIPSVFREHGYRPIVQTAAPEKDGYYYMSYWTETDTEITQGWEEHVVEVDNSPTLEDYKYALTVLGISEFDTKESLASSVSARKTEINALESISKEPIIEVKR